MSEVKSITEVTAIAIDEYSNASFVVIKQLQAKVAKLQAENESLLHMLEQNTPALIQTTDLVSLGISNEQLICETQIVILKDAAINRALSMEECKKLQILTEVLSKYKVVKPTDEELTIKSMSPEALIAAATALEVVPNG